MWKDKIKGIFQDVRRGVEEVCEDVKEKVEKAELGEKLKKVGEDIKEGVEKAEIGDKLKKFGEDIKEQFVPNGQGTSASDESTVVYETTAVVSDVEEKETTEKTAEIDVADEECALTVPTEDGPRGEFTCLNEKTYSFLIPKEEGFVDEGNCHAAEIHQAYGFGREINYEYDAMFCFSIAGEFDCEIKESGVKAAYSRYDSAPTRSKLMEIEHT